jgi:trans-2,3-dihydro-3-hydroxyanthranilate isomerase
MTRKIEFCYRVVDVFTQHPLEGNALAVFTDAVDLDPAMMQRMARELNLVETAFLLPPSRSDCIAQVRIFTPQKEMLFAGHPTIGTGFVLHDAGVLPINSDTFSLEERIGSVSLRVDRGDCPMFWLTTPVIEAGRTFDRPLCAAVLGLSESDLLDFPPLLLSAGNPTLFIPLRSKRAVDQAWLDVAGARHLRGLELEPFCTLAFAATEEGAYARMFAPEYGVPEDPATGSAMGPLAEYMMRHGLVSSRDGTRFVSEQGTKMGRRSLLHVRINGEHGTLGIEVGGYVVPVAKGVMQLSL